MQGTGTSKDLEVALVDGGDVQRVRLAGGLTERSGQPLDHLLAQLKAGVRLEIDLSGIDNVNSIGTRVWAAFIGKCSAGRKVLLENCSVFFIDYVNMARGVLSGLDVVSFKAPFRCSGCGATDERTLESKAIRSSKSFGKHLCKSCGCGLEPVADPDDYFEFLLSP